MFNFDDMKFLNSALNTGAFVVSGDNVMTASWGFVGVMWGKKVFVAPIRDSRFTKTILDKTKSFTVSVPKFDTMKDALKVCGTVSGKNTDKWQLAKIEKVKAKSIDTYVVDGCAKYLECKVLAVVPMKDVDIKDVEKWYPTSDMHNFYFGEIVEEY